MVENGVLLHKIRYYLWHIFHYFKHYTNPLKIMKYSVLHANFSKDTKNERYLRIRSLYEWYLLLLTRLFVDNEVLH